MSTGILLVALYLFGAALTYRYDRDIVGATLWPLMFVAAWVLWLLIALTMAGDWLVRSATRGIRRTTRTPEGK